MTEPPRKEQADNQTYPSNNEANAAIGSGVTIPSVGVRMAIAIIAILPIMVIYPFFQKSFIKGIVIGGVKG